MLRTIVEGLNEQKMFGGHVSYRLVYGV